MTESQHADLNKGPKEVASTFDSLTSRYNAMGALVTGGLDRMWMTALCKTAALHPGERILDLATGTGASPATLAKGGAKVVACDLSEGMIEAGRKRYPKTEFVHGNAMDLDFEDGSFDAVTVPWDLRNIPDPELALREMARVARPCGRLVVLEFSTPPSRVSHDMYNAYQLTVTPTVAHLVSTNDGAYNYLVGSIRVWPTREELGRIIAVNDWSEVEYCSLTGGIACTRHAVKPPPQFFDTDEAGATRMEIESRAMNRPPEDYVNPISQTYGLDKDLTPAKREDDRWDPRQW